MWLKSCQTWYRGIKVSSGRRNGENITVSQVCTHLVYSNRCISTPFVYLTGDWENLISKYFATSAGYKADLKKFRQDGRVVCKKWRFLSWLKLFLDWKRKWDYCNISRHSKTGRFYKQKYLFSLTRIRRMPAVMHRIYFYSACTSCSCLVKELMIDEPNLAKLSQWLLCLFRTWLREKLWKDRWASD